jgi:hypothetical protein
MFNAVAAAPSGFKAKAGTAGTVVLTWANNSLNVNNVSNFTLSWVQNGVTKTLSFAPNSTGATIVKLTSGGSYTFTLDANGSIGMPASATATVTVK